MIEFLAGAITMGFIVAAAFFLRFWRKTADRLFLAFALAFALLALNQALTPLFSAPSEQSGSIYVFRVLAFVLILAAIIDKNVAARARSRKSSPPVA